MPRFVILRHDAPQGMHFDLMLEVGDALRTWALAEAPEPGGETTAAALADHRLAYLDYEGPVSGDRGTVIRYDRGTYTAERQDECEWVVELVGEKLIGRATLQQVSEGPDGWRFSFGRRTGDG